MSAEYLCIQKGHGCLTTYCQCWCHEPATQQDQSAEGDSPEYEVIHKGP